MKRSVALEARAVAIPDRDGGRARRAATRLVARIVVLIALVGVAYLAFSIATG